MKHAVSVPHSYRHSSRISLATVYATERQRSISKLADLKKKSDSGKNLAPKKKPVARIYFFSLENYALLIVMAKHETNPHKLCM